MIPHTHETTIKVRLSVTYWQHPAERGSRDARELAETPDWPAEIELCGATFHVQDGPYVEHTPVVSAYNLPKDEQRRIVAEIAEKLRKGDA